MITKLSDIDIFLSEWLGEVTRDSETIIGTKFNGWIRANQNAPTPMQTYGTWFTKEFIQIGEPTRSMFNYDNCKYEIDYMALSYNTFAVEVTVLGDGAKDILYRMKQHLNTYKFIVKCEEYGIGYLTSQSMIDISAVTNAEMRESGQVTLSFSCVMGIVDTIGIIETVEIQGLDPIATKEFSISKGTKIECCDSIGWIDGTRWVEDGLLLDNCTLMSD